MAFQPVIKEINSKYTKRLNTNRITTKITLNCPDKHIQQILSVGAKPNVISILPASGSTMIEAKALAKAVIIDHDGKYDSLEESIHFTQPIIHSEITPDSILFATLNVINCNNIQAGEHYVSFDLIMDVNIIKVIEQIIPTVQSVDELAFQRTTSIEYSNLIATINDNFVVTNEVELPTNIGAVVQVQSDTILLDAQPNSNIVTLNGKILSNLIYLTNEDKPRLKSQKYCINFTQEVPANDIDSLHQVLAYIQDCGTTYEVQGELSSAKGVLLLTNTYNVLCFISSIDSTQVVCDAFCPQYQLLTTNNTYTIQKGNHTQFFNEKIDGSIILSDDSVRIDRVLATSSNVLDYTLDNDKLTVQGVLYTNVIYQLDDQAQTIGSVLAEIPFNIPLKLNDILDASDLSIHIIVSDIEARNKRSLEIDIIADIIISVTAQSNDTGVVISNIKLGEAITQSTSPMGIYYVDNAQSEWDIAKLLRISPDLILIQNPNITFPITQPTPVIVYRSRNPKS